MQVQITAPGYIPVTDAADIEWVEGFKRFVRRHWLPPVQDVRCSFEDLLESSIPRITLHEADVRLITSLRALYEPYPSPRGARLMISCLDAAIYSRFVQEKDYSIPGMTIRDVEDAIERMKHVPTGSDLSRDPEVELPPEFEISMSIIDKKIVRGKKYSNSHRARERLDHKLKYPHIDDFPKTNEGEKAFNEAYESRAQDYKVALVNGIELNWRCHIDKALPNFYPNLREPNNDFESSSEFKSAKQWDEGFTYHLWILSAMTKYTVQDPDGLDLARSWMHYGVLRRLDSRAKNKSPWLLTQDLVKTIARLAAYMDKKSSIRK